MTSMKAGMLPATRVTLSTVDVCRAWYCKALYMPMESRPSRAKRRQWVRRGLPGRSRAGARGSSTIAASTQRMKLRVRGGTSGPISRPITALAAHSSGGRVIRAAVRQESEGVADMWPRL